MSDHQLTICLITPGHAASTPRLVKEADALVAAGYRVHVVAGSHYEPAMALDETLFAPAGWERTLVRYGKNSAGEIRRKALRKLARFLVSRGARSISLAARVVHSESLRLAAAAAAVRADLYIGHCLAALPAAALAARHRGVPYGFDMEDFHATETLEAMADPADREATRLLCEQLIPGCTHLTAASPMIAEECRRHYGAAPRSILNVFPLSEAPATPITLESPSPNNPLRLYWFSQTVGPGRGLEGVIAALALMRTPVELHVRGQCDDAYRRRLAELARESGLRQPPVFHASAAPDEMVRLAAPFHLGLSVENSTPPNRDICLTNKIFTYLLAGVPVVLTPTRAQLSLASELGEAALVLDFTGNPGKAAAALDRLAADSALLARARAHAWDLGHTRFNWDVAQRDFLASVTSATHSSPRS